MKILLASGSPRRLQFLSSLGHNVIVRPADIEELSLVEGESLEEVALVNAKLKAREVISRYGLLGCDFVAGADTVVVIDGQLLGKAVDQNDAHKMIELLSGKTHLVATGYVLINDGLEIGRLVKSLVKFRQLLPQEIEAYLSDDDWRDKAGAYGVQSRGASLVEEVKGSITNVIGLPILEFLEDANQFFTK